MAFTLGLSDTMSAMSSKGQEQFLVLRGEGKLNNPKKQDHSVQPHETIQNKVEVKVSFVLDTFNKSWVVVPRTSDNGSLRSK